MPIRQFTDAAKRWLGMDRKVQAPSGVSAEFLLTYDDLTIGTLSVDKGVWRFEYSDEFKRQDVLRPIVEFPDVNEIYKSKELWQFFAVRIPSPEQTEVGEILRREHIEEDDAVQLLRRFGKRTIANPFQLESREKEMLAAAR